MGIDQYPEFRLELACDLHHAYSLTRDRVSVKRQMRMPAELSAALGEQGAAQKGIRPLAGHQNSPLPNRGIAEKLKKGHYPRLRGGLNREPGVL